MSQPTRVEVWHAAGGTLPNGTPNGIGGRTTYHVGSHAFGDPRRAVMAADVIDRGITYASPLRPTLDDSAGPGGLPSGDDASVARSGNPASG